MENPNNSPVLVIGATGLLGMEICRRLTDVKRKVRGLVRDTSDPAKVNALQQMGVEIVRGDIKDVTSLTTAFKDIAEVISSASSTLSRQKGDSIETVDNIGQLNVVNAAKKAGVKQFVFISFPLNPESFPLQTAKRVVEKRLIESGINYTILQPTYFMEVWLSPAVGFDYPNSKATIYGEGKNKISWISFKDVAAFAVESLDNPVAINAVFQLGGPDPLGPLEVVNIFEKHTGKNFSIEHVSLEALKAQKMAATDSLSESFAALMIGYGNGNEIDVKESSKISQVKLTSVSDYVKQVSQHN